MTILVDSSVWIDLLADRDTAQTRALSRMVAGSQRVVVGDLVLAEVLQGVRHDQAFARAEGRLALFDVLPICDHAVALKAAHNYRTLRARGITIRKTIDTLIATRCILDDVPLLYADRDFDPFVEHLGLVSALDLPSGVN